VTEIRELDGIVDLADLAELFAVVWGRPGEPPIGSDVLKALAHSGNYVCGAYDGTRLIGGLVGWLGGRPPGELHLHSHILGVLPGSDARGLGFELKQHQRLWCLEREVRLMEWTTDPLIRRNAYFNLTKLGARSNQYLVNVYGAMRDGINAGEESDRLLIRWELHSPEALAAAAGRAPEPDLDALREAGATTILSVGPSLEPLAKERISGRVLLCQVPDDMVEMRMHHPATARAWRLAVRDALTDAIAHGYAIAGATRSGWYVLVAPAE